MLELEAHPPRWAIGTSVQTHSIKPAFEEAEGFALKESASFPSYVVEHGGRYVEVLWSERVVVGFVIRLSM